MHNIQIPNKKKSVPVPYRSMLSSKIFDDLQHLLSCTKNNFDIIGVTEIRIIKQVALLNILNLKYYFFEIFLCPKLLEVALFFTLLLNYHINIAITKISVKWMNWNQLLLKLSTLKNQLLFRESFIDIH